MPSTVIRDFAYDRANRALEVTFTSGRRYCYVDVPEHVPRTLASAQSKGRYFNACIRDAFRFVELPGDREAFEGEVWAL